MGVLGLLGRLPGRTVTGARKCDRCLARPGAEQPEDGDAARLFATAAHHSSERVCLCNACRKTLEGMTLRAAGVRSRAGSVLADRVRAAGRR